MPRLSEDQAWKALCERIAELDTLAGVESLLHWDQQVGMPHGAVEGRGGQLELIGRLLHERWTAPRLGELLSSLEASPGLSAFRKAGVRNLRRLHDRAVRVDADLVGRLARAASEGQVAWCEARERADFTVFAPHLEKLLALSTERARAIGPDRHPYDVLLEDFDPGIGIDYLRGMFRRLRAGLVTILDRVRDVPASSDGFPAVEAAGQLELQRRVAVALGYDLERGAMGLAPHPFSCQIGPRDIRIATHLKEKDPLYGLLSTIHEVGHALYDQGLPVDESGSAVYSPCSMSIHESQSRFWENAIGRSRAFFRWLEPVLKECFPSVPLDAGALHRGVTRVAPGPVRLEADEVTYDLHVILRFELEVALFDGSLEVDELPERWNELSRELLGAVPASDAEGVLQDAHWSDGAFGYFPSYTVGNLYAASLQAALRASVRDLDGLVETGRFAPIVEFLQDRIYRHGHLHDPPELMRQAVGERDHVADLLAHHRRRYLDTA